MKKKFYLGVVLVVLGFEFLTPYIFEDITTKPIAAQWELMRSQNEISDLNDINDSLIYNAEFRVRTLGENFTRDEFDSARAQNRENLLSLKDQFEIFLKDKKKVDRQYSIYKTIDRVLDIILVLTLIHMLVTDYKSRKAKKADNL